MSSDPTRRFDDRVEDYVRYRPVYPAAMFDWLRDGYGITSGWDVADIGAGTGISSRLWLDRGHRVAAVEPNAPMRAAAVHELGSHDGFRAIDGTAEATQLADASVDLISVAQAFHWFDALKVRTEWARILRPQGLAAIFWNTRRLRGTVFLEGYEALLHEFGIDYAAVAERHPDDAAMQAWFGSGLRGQESFQFVQPLDFEQVRGRLLSSSWAPLPSHPHHVPMLSALRELFGATASDGHVEMAYDTRIFLGALTAD